MKKNKQDKYNYVAIEQVEDGEACISRIEADNIQEAYDVYQQVDGGTFIIITIEAYRNMCMSGVQK